MNRIEQMKARIERRRKTNRIPDPVPKPFDYEVKTLCLYGRNNIFGFTPEELWSIYLKHSTLIKNIVDNYEVNRV